MNTAGEHECRGGVAQVVEPDPRKARVPEEPAKRDKDVARGRGRPDGQGAPQAQSGEGMKPKPLKGPPLPNPQLPWPGERRPRLQGGPVRQTYTDRTRPSEGSSLPKNKEGINAPIGFRIFGESLPACGVGERTAWSGAATTRPRLIPG